MRSRDVRIAAHGSWTLVSIVIMLSSQNLREAVQLCHGDGPPFGLLEQTHTCIQEAHGAPHGALGNAFAGLAIFGVSKGVAFYTLAVLRSASSCCLL